MPKSKFFIESQKTQVSSIKGEMSHAESDYLEKLIEKYLDRRAFVSV